MLNNASIDSVPGERESLPPADFYDPVVEAYKRDIDRSLLRENLKLTPAERARKFRRFMKLCFELRGAAWRKEVTKIESK